MLKWAYNLMFKIGHWELHPNLPPESHNCIMVAAPHTSNWDFIYAIGALNKLGLTPRFTIKKEFNRFPFGKMISNLGALWIDRSTQKKSENKKGMTQIMAGLFRERKEPLTLIVTAEATRSKSDQWRTGFYFAALEAKVPICLGFLDYKKRVAGVGKCFMPSGVIEEDMAVIMDFYKDINPKFPDQFSLDVRYFNKS